MPHRMAARNLYRLAYHLWNRYLELCIDQDMWKDRAIHLLEHETDASLPDILEFIEEHWQNCATDEEKIAQFREWIAPEKEQTRKKNFTLSHGPAF